MGVHFIVHWPRGASEKAEVANLRPAPVRKLRVKEKRFALMRMAATSHPPWATEALARCDVLGICYRTIRRPVDAAETRHGWGASVDASPSASAFSRRAERPRLVLAAGETMHAERPLTANDRSLHPRQDEEAQ